MKLHIKNMVCPRCITAVRGLLTAMHLSVLEVKLGEAQVEEELSPHQLTLLAHQLSDLGFELLDDPSSYLVEQIRVSVLQWVRMEGDRPKLSEYISSSLHKEYSGLTKLFTQVRGITIEHYAIQHRIEYAKELLCYSQSTISEIAYQLGYSSPTHLTNQFKQQTGMTPKAFRTLDHKERLPLDAL